MNGEKLQKSLEGLDKTDKKNIRKVQRKLDEKLYIIYEMLSEMEDGDGFITRRKLYEVERKLNEYEREYRKEYEEQLKNTLLASTTLTLTTLKSKMREGTEDIDVKKLEAFVFNTIRDREGKDRRKLSQRAWGNAIDMRTKLSNSIRQGILSRKKVTEIIRDIKEVSKREEWKVRRLVSSEIKNTYRLTILKVSEQLNIEYVKFYDGTCGNRNHHLHKCYELANKNKYGKGDGVYKATDTEIISPHPQCTSIIVPLIDE